MKRFALLLLGVVFAVPCAVGAQGLTMQMSNGWAFTFAGNVHAFLVYEKEDSALAIGSPGAIVGNSGDGATRIRTGLLPTFATFAAKGKEGNLDLGVHFGFAPQIQCGGALHDCFGAQIDMRQVYLTVGGSFGTLLAGRELGLFGRQNILTDQTLYGVGATGGQYGGGTTLGRIGFGYDYPNFVPQFTYTSRSDRPLVFSVGLFDPSVNGPYTQIQLPRVEAEAVWSRQQHKFWVGGLVQSNKSPADSTATSYGLSGGVKLGFSGFGIVASGFWGKGIGTTLLFSNGTSGGAGSDDLRTTIGYIGQVTYTPQGSKVTLAASYGANQLKYSTNEDTPGARFKTENGLISGGLYYQWTKSLKFVAEFNYAWSKEKENNPPDNNSFAPAVGLMLFF